MDSALRFRNVLLAELIYILLLLPFPWLLTKQEMHWVFSEEGPFEVLSAVFWAALGLLCFMTARQAPRRLIPCGIAAFIGCARELDLHTAITGMSIFKSHYYLKTPAPIAEKLLVGLLTIAIFAVLVDVFVAGIRALRAGALREDWMLSALLAFVTTAATKLLDKLQSFVHDFTGHWLPQIYGLVINSLEEGVEMSLPLLFIVALVQYQRRATSAPTAYSTPAFDRR
jgi:hypothetical protein